MTSTIHPIVIIVIIIIREDQVTIRGTRPTPARVHAPFVICWAALTDISPTLSPAAREREGRGASPVPTHLRLLFFCCLP